MPKTSVLVPAINEKARVMTAGHLQSVLFLLIDLALQSKQAHWNVVGPNFRPLHLHLDELWDTVQKWSDAVAERMLALDVPARGQVTDIRDESTLDALPPGRLADTKVISLVADRIETVAARTREAMEAVEELDLVTQDLFMEVIHDLEKHLWMFRSQIQAG
ncbi:MAG: Dps family protein [Anaerolineales bacterium]